MPHKGNTIMCTMPQPSITVFFVVHRMTFVQTIHARMAIDALIMVMNSPAFAQAQLITTFQIAMTSHAR